MKSIVLALVTIVLALGLAPDAEASTHHEHFSVSCGTLWLAVKDTLRNSGKYGIVGINNEEMTAAYVMGGNWAAKRINSVVLNEDPNGCDLQVQTAFTGLAHNDEGDFTKRVASSLERLLLKSHPRPVLGPVSVVERAAQDADKKSFFKDDASAYLAAKGYTVGGENPGATIALKIERSADTIIVEIQATLSDGTDLWTETVSDTKFIGVVDKVHKVLDSLQEPQTVREALRDAPPTQ